MHWDIKEAGIINGMGGIWKSKRMMQYFRDRPYHSTNNFTTPPLQFKNFRDPLPVKSKSGQILHRREATFGVATVTYFTQKWLDFCWKQLNIKQQKCVDLMNAHQLLRLVVVQNLLNLIVL